jgi:hypothetical protein
MAEHRHSGIGISVRGLGLGPLFPTLAFFGSFRYGTDQLQDSPAFGLAGMTTRHQSQLHPPVKD